MELFTTLPVSLVVLLLLVAAAFFAGFIDSVAGGGGLISLPALLLAGIPPHTAIGTSKFMASIGTTSSLLIYSRKGLVVWRVVATGLLFAWGGSTLGAKVALYIDNALLGKIIIFLLPLGLAANFLPVRKPSIAKPCSRKRELAITGIICSVVGFYDGFFGPGTGSFMLIGLHVFLGMQLVAASATTKALNLASNVAATVMFVWYGKVLYLVSIPMACANICGNIVGSRLAIAKGAKIVRIMLFFSLLLLFTSLVWRYYV